MHSANEEDNTKRNLESEVAKLFKNTMLGIKNLLISEGPRIGGQNQRLQGE